jgi:PAS domain S-box-containing protein
MSALLRLLVVDDSEDEMVFVVRTLRRAGYTVEATRVDTAEAMADALDRGSWDVIVSDHEMPSFNVLGALALRNERRPEIPFVIVSGRIGEDTIVAAMKAGAQEYVLKRDLSRLGAAIERSMREMTSLTEKKRAEAALRESEERYALAVRGSRDGLWDWNITMGEVYYAPRFKEMLGFEGSTDKAVMETFTDRVHPDDREALTSSLEAHLKERQPFSVECRVRAAGGELRWFSFRGQALWGPDGEPVRMAGSLTDLTDRKRVEEELRDKLEIIQRQLEIIQQQREEIRILMTPIIQVWNGVLMAPVLGALDGDRAAQLMEMILQAVIRSRSRYAILDLTAVESIDAATAGHVIKIVAAVELLGACGIVVGIQPQVAMTIVAVGIDLSRVVTLADLREALLFCMQRLGIDPRARRRDSA